MRKIMLVLVCSIAMASVASAVPFVDTPQTWGLYHMDELIDGPGAPSYVNLVGDYRYTPDDNSSSRLMARHAYCHLLDDDDDLWDWPTISADGVYGNSMNFAYGDAMPTGSTWKGVSGGIAAVNIDMWFKPTADLSSPTFDTVTGFKQEVLVNATSTWQLGIIKNWVLDDDGVTKIYAGTTDLRFTVWTDGAARVMTLEDTVALGEWNHVRASIGEYLVGPQRMGIMGLLQLVGAKGAGLTTDGLAMKYNEKGVTFGWKGNKTATRYDGLIDEVRIIPEPATMLLLGLGGLMFRKRR